jgi:uncharacterized spore protein YtfJ
LEGSELEIRSGRISDVPVNRKFDRVEFRMSARPTGKSREGSIILTGGPMLTNIVDGVLERLVKSGSVRTVYGDPVTVGGRTVIPVARVGYGFGGGFGKASGLAPPGDHAPEEGGGGGGGMMARPVGALEITAEGTRFIEFGQGRALGAAFAAGLGLGLLIARAGRR